ncbi:unnamed protein product [Colias eurytheme]|nr:unnamed protein product [Colias eurytheme]
MRPFWVIKPRIENRETCMCKTHANMEFVISSLKNNKIILENSITEVLNTLTCEKTTVACLLRKCEVCCNKMLNFKEFDNSKTISYYAWEKAAKSYTKNNKEKYINAIAKVNKVDTPKDVIKLFLKTITPFMAHCGRIKNHYASVKKIKEELSENECLIHVDFSENYNTKYGEEVQTVHFSGGRSQITLHTSVIYYKRGDQTIPQSFCTISKSLRHDASAVWAHLVPIMEQINEDAPNVSTLHVVSDSPSTQYRNKKIFYIITQLKIYLPKLRTVVWHYSESGHGKGAPDGIGGVLKRTADQLVAFGKDIPDMETLVEKLQSEVSGVKIKTVEDHEISVKDWLLPKQLEPFSGSMKLHQIVWNIKSTIGLAMRSLSCVEPLCLYNAIECPHGCHLGFYEIPKESEPVPDEIISSTPSSKQIVKDNRLSINKPAIHCFKASEPFFLKTKNISQNKVNLSIDMDNIIDCENVLPSTSFFENINSNILTQFERSASDIAENKKGDRSRLSSSSSGEESIFNQVIKNHLETSKNIDTDSDKDLNIFADTKRSKKPLKRKIINIESDKDLNMYLNTNRAKKLPKKLISIINSDSEEDLNIFKKNTKIIKKPPKKRRINNRESDEENIFEL